MRVSPRVKSAIIEQTIRCLFQDRMEDVYSGRLSTKEVVQAVCTALKEHEARLSKQGIAEVYEQIRELGPVGENDTHWLSLYRRAS